MLPGGAVIGHDVSAPPTSFALRMRPWLLLIFVLLLIVAVARFIILDVMGGFFVVLTVMIGWYSLREGINMTWLLCLAIILFLNSIFDSFIILSHVVRSQGKYIGRHFPWYINLIRAAMLAGPIIELVGACMCWFVYKDHVLNLSLETGFLGPDLLERLQYGAAAEHPSSEPGARGEQAEAGPTRGNSGHALSAPRFQAFVGKVHRLGS